MSLLKKAQNSFWGRQSAWLADAALQQVAVYQMPLP
jgi:hypothetical protein